MANLPLSSYNGPDRDEKNELKAAVEKKVKSMAASDNKSEQEIERRVEGRLFKERFDSLDGKVDRVLYILEGNGQPGIIKVVDRHDQWIVSRQWIERGILLCSALAVVVFIIYTAVRIF